MAVPNQKHIWVHKTPKGNNGYTYFTWEVLEEARAKLKPPAFMLWTYLAQNKDGYDFDLSSSDYCGSCTMGRDAYSSAIKELEAKGYLVLKSGKTKYDFYEKPIETSGTSVEKSNNGLQENPTTVAPQSKVSSISVEKSDNENQINPITVADKSDNGLQINPIRNIIEYNNNTITDTILEDPSTDKKQEEKIVGSIGSDVLSQLPREKVEIISETLVRLTNIPKPGLYKIAEVKVVGANS